MNAERILSQDDGCFWYPFRPSLRWPIRTLAVVLLLAVAAEGIFAHRWRWAGFVLPIWLLTASFDTPYRRRKTASCYFGIAIILGVPLVLVAVYIITAFT